MKRILQKGKHWLKAKGRHGTHSPFVYAFVEQVMRSEKQFSINKISNSLARKQVDLIGRTIQYLNPETIYTDVNLFEIVKAISNNAATAFKMLELDISKDSYEPAACFVCLPSDETINFLKKIADRQICSAIIPLNQKDLTAMANWEKLNLEPAFKMALDTWYIGIISNHPDFKIKQYFRLR